MAWISELSWVRRSPESVPMWALVSESSPHCTWMWRAGIMRVSQRVAMNRPALWLWAACLSRLFSEAHRTACCCSPDTRRRGLLQRRRVSVTLRGGGMLCWPPVSGARSGCVMSGWFRPVRRAEVSWVRTTLWALQDPRSEASHLIYGYVLWSFVAAESSRW